MTDGLKNLMIKNMKLLIQTCSRYWLMSSNDFVLLTAKTQRKPSPVLMY